MGAAGSERAATDDEVAAMARLLGASLAEGGLGLLVVVGRDPQRRRRATRCRRGSPPRTSWSRSAREVGRHEGTTLEFIPGVGTFTEREAALMGRMSAAADRPLNWNVLIVMAGLEAQVAEQLGASDRAADLGGRVLGLTMPAPVSPRLSFASGFLLDTIPGWAERDDRAAAPSGSALLASAEARPS